jgi:hypothetical protein
MLKLTAGILSLSIFAGLFVGIHFPHIRKHQAEQEFCLRANRKNLNELCKLVESTSKTSCLSIFTKGIEATDLAVDNCLENFGFRDSDWASKETSIDLYKKSELDKKYARLQYSVGRMFYLGHYRLASLCADAALSVWDLRQNHDACVAERFADQLILIGRYRDAKSVLESILPTDQCPTERLNPVPFLVYKQELMGQALMGIHDYQAAKTAMERHIPGLTEEYDSQSLNVYLGCAYLGLGDKCSAHKAFSKQPHQLDDIFEDMCELRPGDAASARKVVSASESLCKQLKNLDGVPELDFVSDILRINGFSHESKMVAELVERFMHHEGALG